LTAVDRLGADRAELAGTGGQNAHRLHRLPAPVGMRHEQGVVAGAGAVHPGQPAFNPETGFVEPGDAAGGDLLADMLGELIQVPAARAVSAETVPEDSGMPTSSASACAVRSLDRNCPAYR
jgi:hypothetical protein